MVGMADGKEKEIRKISIAVNTLVKGMGVLTEAVTGLGGRVDGLSEDIQLLTLSTAKEFENVYGRFEKVDERFKGIDKRFDGIDKKFDGVDKRFDGIDKRFDGIDKRLDSMEAGISSVHSELRSFKDETYRRFDAVDEKIQETNENVGGIVSTYHPHIIALEEKVFGYSDLEE